jgi:hypothetical protein
VPATVPLEAKAKQIEAVSALQGRILGAEPGEVQSSAAVVRQVLAHELMARARSHVQTMPKKCDLHPSDLIF